MQTLAYKCVHDEVQPAMHPKETTSRDPLSSIISSCLALCEAMWLQVEHLVVTSCMKLPFGVFHYLGAMSMTQVTCASSHALEGWVQSLCTLKGGYSSYAHLGRVQCQAARLAFGPMFDQIDSSDLHVSVCSASSLCDVR